MNNKRMSGDVEFFNLERSLLQIIINIIIIIVDIEIIPYNLNIKKVGIVMSVWLLVINDIF